MKEYKIIEGIDASELERKVNESLVAGCELSGCISTLNADELGVTLFQSMIRVKEGEQGADNYPAKKHAESESEN